MHSVFLISGNHAILFSRVNESPKLLEVAHLQIEEIINPTRLDVARTYEAVA